MLGIALCCDSFRELNFYWRFSHALNLGDGSLFFNNLEYIHFKTLRQWVVNICLTLAFVKKVLVITYYWPPAGGAGVQRWLKMVKYLTGPEYQIAVLNVRENVASYPVTDSGFS